MGVVLHGRGGGAGPTWARPPARYAGVPKPGSPRAAETRASLAWRATDTCTPPKETLL